MDEHVGPVLDGSNDLDLALRVAHNEGFEELHEALDAITDPCAVLCVTRTGVRGRGFAHPAVADPLQVQPPGVIEL